MSCCDSQTRHPITSQSQLSIMMFQSIFITGNNQLEPKELENPQPIWVGSIIGLISTYSIKMSIKWVHVVKLWRPRILLTSEHTPRVSSEVKGISQRWSVTRKLFSWVMRAWYLPALCLRGLGGQGRGQCWLCRLRGWRTDLCLWLSSAVGLDWKVQILWSVAKMSLLNHIDHWSIWLADIIIYTIMRFTVIYMAVLGIAALLHKDLSQTPC